MSGPAVEDLEIPQIDWGSPTVRLDPCPKRIRVLAAGRMVVDSRSAVMLLEPRHLPVYYFPIEDVRMDLLESVESSIVSPFKGRATFWTLKAGEQTISDAFFSYDGAVPGCPPLSGLIAMYWDRMDAVFEEDEEVFTHPREPHHRIEVLNSSRHVLVAAGDRTLAESTRPVMLLETHLSPRLYLPKFDVRFSELTPSPTQTGCAYKGRATQYWSVAGGIQDVAWCYPFPTVGCAAIASHVAFFQEKVEVYLDGERVQYADSPWS
ncbi:MAG: DUF427 domain-containing protein [Actinomycetota bacterium]